MSATFRHIARLLRPGLYLLDTPVSLASEMNFLSERDRRAGGCELAEVGEPIVYRLHAIRIRNPEEWHGHDDPLPERLSDRQRARRIPKDTPAVVFSPDELRPMELLRFLQRARRLGTPTPNNDSMMGIIDPPEPTPPSS